ncbi:MAG: HlyD family secretion protein [Gemmatales bacterium]
MSSTPSKEHPITSAKAQSSHALGEKVPANTESSQPAPSTSAKPASPGRLWLMWIIGVIVLVGGLFYAYPWVVRSFQTVCTDDAYVSGHVTFVAPRVAGQVARVLVDDNNRVKKGDLLVQLDKEPYQVQVSIAEAAVATAKSDLVAAQAQARSIEGQMRSLRFNLQRSIEEVENQIAILRSRVATMDSKKASLAKAQADYDRAVPLVKTGAVSQEELDLRKQALLVAQAQVEEALQGIYQVRVSLGLPIKPETGTDLSQVPKDIDQTFSTVRQAQASLMQAAAQLGINQSFSKTPKEMIAEFYKRDPQGDLDRIYDQLIKEAPTVKQAEAKLLQAQRNLEQAQLNLRYCDIVSEIDGVVTRRNVNPGNNVTVGQSLMAVRSLTDIWIDANFKETQLASLRIGQPVDIEVDMYGSKQLFKGRVSGFTMGTGSTLAILPAENATGNFVKVVQRLPVRIDLLNYDPDKVPLFIGLSVTPYVQVKEASTGADAGKILQPHAPTSPGKSGTEKQP